MRIITNDVINEKARAGLGKMEVVKFLQKESKYIRKYVEIYLDVI
jgi:hypothetical protein